MAKRRLKLRPPSGAWEAPAYSALRLTRSHPQGGPRPQSPIVQGSHWASICCGEMRKYCPLSFNSSRTPGELGQGLTTIVRTPLSVCLSWTQCTGMGMLELALPCPCPNGGTPESGKPSLNEGTQARNGGETPTSTPPSSPTAGAVSAVFGLGQEALTHLQVFCE